MNILYNTNIIVNKNHITPKQASFKPNITLENLNTNSYYTLIMIDTDVQINNKKVNKLHWCVVNIKGNNFETGIELINYQGPNPPKDSGNHHYIFTLYEQDELTNSQLIIKEHFYPSLNTLLDILNLSNKKQIYSNYFVSSYQNGGKKKSKKNKSKKNKLQKKKSKKNRK